MPLSKSIQYTSEFLDFLSPIYRLHLIQRLEENCFCLEKVRHKDRMYKQAYSDLVGGKPYIYLPFDKTIRDTYTLTHEIIHDITLEENISLARHLFCEFFSLLAEKLQKDYFAKYKNIKDHKLSEIENFLVIKDKAKLIKFELKLLSNYLKKGYLTLETILEIISKYDFDYALIVSKHLKQICNAESEFSFLLGQRDLLGWVLSSYMHDCICRNAKKVEEFIKLNNCINDFEVEDVLNCLELDYHSGKFFHLTEDSYKKLENAYQREIKRIG